MRYAKIGEARSPELPTAALTIALLVLTQSVAAAPPPGKGGGKPGPGDGGGGEASCSYPAFADVPKERLERRERKRRYDDFSTAPRYEWVRQAITVPETLALVEGGQLNGAAWTHETMVDPLNRSGNAGIDADGNVVCTNCTPEGKRHSAWYGSASELVSTSQDSGAAGSLSLRGRIVDQPDPTRPGTMPWAEIRPETTWLKTWERGRDDKGRWFVEGGLSTLNQHKFKAPLYLKASVNFSRMQTPGFRLSLWLMPATFEGSTFTKSDSPDCSGVQDNLLTNGCYSDPTPEFRSEAYDRNWKNGYEMDLFEYEPAGVIEVTADYGTVEQLVCGNAIEFSALNDYIGNRGKDTEYAVKNHFEGFEKGYCDPAVDYGALACDKTYANPAQATDYLINDDVWHKIGFLWTPEELVWIFNDEVVLEIAEPERIPHESVHQYLNLSREMTNGLSAATIIQNDQTYDTYLPAESGLYGWDGRSNMGDFLEQVAGDEALIRYIKVWDLDSLQP